MQNEDRSDETLEMLSELMSDLEFFLEWSQGRPAIPKKMVTAYISLLCSKLDASQMVDIGCGKDDTICEMAREMDGIKVVGADLKHRIEERKEKCKSCSCKLELAEYDLKEPRDIGKFGVAYSNNLLHHVDDINKAMESTFRLLTDPGAIFFMDRLWTDIPYLPRENVPRYREEREKMEKGLGKRGVTKLLGRELSDEELNNLDCLAGAYTKEEILEAASKAGFRHVKYQDLLGKKIMLFGFRDDSGRVHVDETPKGYDIFVKRESGLWLP